MLLFLLCVSWHSPGKFANSFGSVHSVIAHSSQPRAFSGAFVALVNREKCLIVIKRVIYDLSFKTVCVVVGTRERYYT